MPGKCRGGLNYEENKGPQRDGDVADGDDNLGFDFVVDGTGFLRVFGRKDGRFARWLREVVVMHKVIYYLLPLVFLVLAAMWWMGGFEGVKDAVGSIFEDVDVGFGAEKLTAEPPLISESHESSIRSLVGTMKKMKESGEKDCFGKYNVLPDLGETTIELRDGGIVVSTLKGDQVLINLTEELNKGMKGIKLCAVTGDATEQFIESFLNEKSWKEKEIKQGYYFVPNINIYYQSGGVLRRGNVIRIPTFDSIDRNDNFQSKGYLYTPGEGNICFFPTAGLWSDPNGLKDGYFEEDNREGIPRQIEEGRLKLCGEELKKGKVITHCRDYDNKGDCNADVEGIHQENDNYCRWDENSDNCELEIVIPGRGVG